MTIRKLIVALDGDRTGTVTADSDGIIPQVVALRLDHDGLDFTGLSWWVDDVSLGAAPDGSVATIYTVAVVLGS